LQGGSDFDKIEKSALNKADNYKNGLFGTVYGFCLWGVIL
jgi:hypothetical protein